MRVSITHLPKKKLLVSFYMIALGAERCAEIFSDPEKISLVACTAKTMMNEGKRQFEQLDLGCGEVFLGIDLSGDTLDLARYNDHYGWERGAEAVQKVSDYQAKELMLLKARVVFYILKSSFGRDLLNSVTQSGDGAGPQGDLTITFARDHIACSTRAADRASAIVAEPTHVVATDDDTGPNSPVTHRM